MTINPDFSIIEADEIEIDVNTRFSGLFCRKTSVFYRKHKSLSHTDHDLSYEKDIRSDIRSKVLGVLIKEITSSV